MIAELEMPANEVTRTKMPRGRKIKSGKPPTRLERLERLQARIVALTEELINGGFGSLLKPPGAIQLSEAPDSDPKTKGFIGKVKEPLSSYLQRVSVKDNFSQRPPFDHVSDSIYRRLIRDFISGAAMPESKVAALSRTAKDCKVESLDDDEARFSLIDGLQRLWCYCTAVLLVFRREQLVKDGVVPPDAWEYFKETVESTGDPKTATETLLRKSI